jgi:uncharacterized protein (DUF111 family)
VKLTALSTVDMVVPLSNIILRETSTLGVRTYVAFRRKCRRWQSSVATPWGTVKVKVKEFGSDRRAAPEYEDCSRIAREQGVPIARVYRAAIISAEAEITEQVTAS